MELEVCKTLMSVLDGVHRFWVKVLLKSLWCRYSKVPSLCNYNYSNTFKETLEYGVD